VCLDPGSDHTAAVPVCDPRRSVVGCGLELACVSGFDLIAEWGSLAVGKSRSKIATELFIDLETVKTHIKNIYHKLDVNSKDEAIKVARESKYI